MKYLKRLGVFIIVISMWMTGCATTVVSSGVTPKNIIESQEGMIGYYVEGEITEDAVPAMFFVFKNGEVTVYRGEQNTLGELAAMTDEEIIELLQDREYYQGTVTVTVYTEFLSNEAEMESIDMSIKYGVMYQELNWLLDANKTDHCKKGTDVGGSIYYGYNAMTGDGSTVSLICFRTNAENFELGFDSGKTEGVKVESLGGI